MLQKRLSYIVIALFTILVLNLPMVGASVAAEGIGQTEKISNNWGTQGAGNAYGLGNKDNIAATGLASETSSAPLPPVLAVLALIFGVGLKTVRGKRQG